MTKDQGPRTNRGLSLPELLAAVAALSLVLGLIVSLARRVRSDAAEGVTARVLLELEDALYAYRQRHGQLPDLPPLVLPDDENESVLQARAAEHNRLFVRELGIGIPRPARRPDASEDGAGEEAGKEVAGGAGGEGASVLGSLSAGLFDGTRLLDPWGRPFAYMPAGESRIGIAPGNAPFFFSAGPDGRYLTRQDNLYSYELALRQ